MSSRPKKQTHEGHIENVTVCPSSAGQDVPGQHETIKWDNSVTELFLFSTNNLTLMQRSMGNFVQMQMQFNWTLGRACRPCEGAGVRRLVLLQVVRLTLHLIVI